jgi:hypothetical protein
LIKGVDPEWTVFNTFIFGTEFVSPELHLRVQLKQDGSPKLYGQTTVNLASVQEFSSLTPQVAALDSVGRLDLELAWCSTTDPPPSIDRGGLLRRRGARPPTAVCLTKDELRALYDWERVLRVAYMLRALYQGVDLWSSGVPPSGPSLHPSQFPAVMRWVFDHSLWPHDAGRPVVLRPGLVRVGLRFLGPEYDLRWRFIDGWAPCPGVRRGGERTVYTAKGNARMMEGYVSETVYDTQALIMVDDERGTVHLGFRGTQQFNDFATNAHFVQVSKVSLM